MRGILASAIFLVGALAVTPGCEKAEAAVDCGQVCSRYDECRQNIDVDGCTKTCADKLEDQQYRNNIQLCETCIEKGTCEQVSDCWANCSIDTTPVAD